ncbi:MAG: WbqC family protein [Bacteroidota bacterium]
MNLIVDLQYFPSVTFYKNVDKFSNIVFEQYEHYQKMSFRNRCQITGAGGLINLSVPLEKGRDQKTLLKDVRISDRGDWQAQHWKTILSCYSRSPWFEFYRDELDGLYRKPFHFLLDWNLTCFEWSLKVLQMPVSFALTREYHKNYEVGVWTDWRGKLLPKNRKNAVSPIPSGSIRQPAEPMPETPVKYRQVFEERIGFLPNLSILDLLFCEGKNARILLLQD